MVSQSVRKASITLLCIGISGPNTVARFTQCILFTELCCMTLEQKNIIENSIKLNQQLRVYVCVLMNIKYMHMFTEGVANYMSTQPPTQHTATHNTNVTCTICIHIIKQCWEDILINWFSVNSITSQLRTYSCNML